jgi:hypothetical protein
MDKKSLIVGVLVVGLAACGGKGKGAVANGGGGGGGGGGARLPWEAALKQGASFTLQEDIEGGDSPPVTVTVTAVEEAGAARVYRLSWGEDGAGGPSSIRVEGATVTINDAKAEDMQEPWTQEGGDATCYGEDMSNPEGCEDVCDAHLCISPTDGIVSVFGLYAPNYSSFSAR